MIVYEEEDSDAEAKQEGVEDDEVQSTSEKSDNGDEAGDETAGEDESEDIFASQTQNETDRNNNDSQSLSLVSYV